MDNGREFGLFWSGKCFIILLPSLSPQPLLEYLQNIINNVPPKTTPYKKSYKSTPKNMPNKYFQIVLPKYIDLATKVTGVIGWDEKICDSASEAEELSTIYVLIVSLNFYFVRNIFFRGDISNFSNTNFISFGTFLIFMTSNCQTSFTLWLPQNVASRKW